MKKTAVFIDDLFLEHKPGAHHVESPDRLAVIYEQLKRPEFQERFLFSGSTPASKEVLGLVHTPAHINRIAATAGREFVGLDPDTGTSARSYDAACLAAGAVVGGVEMLVSGEIDNGFALVRPPGHHAEADRPMGFCLFNNVAVGARYALDKLGISRVLVVDWDIHHGNGTQHSFYDSSQVFYFSTHQYPYYPGSGGVGEVGTGPGMGFTLNVPLAGGQGDQDFVSIFREILVPVARKYRPELILVSAGFDIYEGDPLGTMRVTAQGFGAMTRVMMALAEEVCQGRLLFTLEGGYNLIGLRDGVLAVLAALNGRSDDGPELATVAVPGLEEVHHIAKKFWNI